MTTPDPQLDAALYLKGLERPIALYYLSLPPCCQDAFRAYDRDRDGYGCGVFICHTHGLVEVSLDIATQIIAKEKAQRFHILRCFACTQKNRVDMARVLASGKRPICGKCKAPLHGMAN
jgi:hypothetical protein